MPADPAPVFHAQREAHRREGTPPLEHRRERLRRLERAIRSRSREIERALAADFGKPPAETRLTEVFIAVSEIAHARRNLARWMRPRRVATGLLAATSRAEIRREPRGACLILSPWNYPFQLAIVPLASAMAAGNRVVLKPSELAPQTSAFLAAFVADLFPPEEVAVIEGDAATARALVELPFDHVFFTGSTAVGKLVMAAAAKNLASVTLELGGKSPAIVDANADVAGAARRLSWGKFLNAGQTCVAPDYVLAHASIAGELARKISDGIGSMYGPDPARSPDYCRIIDARHFERLARFLDESVAAGATIAAGGGRDPAERFIAPTVLTGVRPDMAIMREEIFGPVLPIIAYQSDDEARAIVRSLPHPLALYLFSRRKAWIEDMIAALPSGDAVVNDAVAHYANPRLPFGGVGASGMGHAHGEAGFVSFSHERTVLRQPRATIIGLLYPPYTRRVSALISAATRFLAGR
jgi:aldehyde dehydrogenase (NAD+)